MIHQMARFKMSFNFFMDYKYDLLIEMNDLIVNRSKSNLKNTSTPAHASTDSFT